MKNPLGVILLALALTLAIAVLVLADALGAFY